MDRAAVTVAAGLACVMLTQSVPAAATSAAGYRIGGVRKAVDTVAKVDGVVGVIGEAYYDGKRVGRGSAGSRFLDGEGGKIPSDARYRIWSQTKRMTATVLLQLVKEGKLGVDDKLGEVLPSTVEQDLVERAGDITILQLLHHRSGIPDYTGPGTTDLRPFDDLTTYHTWEELSKISRARPRTSAPGEMYDYANINYILLGAIIEELTGNTLAKEFERRLFKPLKMSQTYLPAKPEQGIKGPHGHGYYPQPDGSLRDVDRLNSTTLGAAGGAISTARDLTTFYRALAQGKLLPPNLRDMVEYPDNKQSVCGGTVGLFTGSGPGGNAVSFTSADGRLQFAVSATTSARALPTLRPALFQAAEAVLCPGA
ncbi:serine hydrolase domain-containing protein [Nonomuraea sp. NPDC046802]|uniref:serine hydrolase domain-containing protein n=1 Tax=Nonomuraea sp. NPDC046802 TaxID=3154919 RepID=UPI0033CA2579